MKNYDVIIIGAGLAGLSLGSELSKKHNILVIEKNQIKKEHKTWNTEESIIKNVGLDQFISASFDKSYFKFLNNEKQYVHDKIVTVDDVAVLNYFEKTIVNNKSKVLENCNFIDIIETKENSINIKTSEGIFSTRLLIDCSGIDSKLTTKNQIYDKIFYLPVYGGIYNISLINKEICVAEVIINDFPLKLIEVFPANKNQALVYTFQYSKKNIDPKIVKDNS